MTEEQARAVMVVRAVEEADPHGRLLTLADRRARALAAEDSDPTQWLIERAERLRRKIFDSHQALATLDERLGVAGRQLGVVLAVAGGVVGIFGAALVGRDLRVHIVEMSLLILGLALWTALTALMRRVFHRTPAVDRLVAWVRRRMAAESDRSPLGEQAAAAAGYVALWADATGEIQRERLVRGMHWAAVAWVFGAVAAMLWMGGSARYLLAWESEWLGREGSLSLARAALAPVGWGGSLPALEGPAGPWVLRFAGALLVWVAGPRALLAFLAGQRADALARDLPVDLEARYFRRLLSPSRGSRVAVLPYALELAGQRGDALRSALTERFGLRSDVQVEPTVGYGALEVVVAECDVVAVVFSVRATPEPDAQGDYLAAVAAAVGDEVRRLLVVDVDGDLDNLRSSGRLDGRRGAWASLAQEAGFEVMELDEVAP